MSHKSYNSAKSRYRPRMVHVGGVTGIIRHPKTIILYSIAERARVRSAPQMPELAACKTLAKSKLPKQQQGLSYCLIIKLQQ